MWGHGAVLQLLCLCNVQVPREVAWIHQVCVQITEVFSLWNAIRWQWIGKLVQLLGSTKLLGAQEKSRGGFCLGSLICLFAFHVSIINFNHSNQTLNRPAPTGTSGHVPAQELLLFSFSIASFSSDQQEDFFCLLPCSSCWVILPESMVRDLPLASLIRMQ